MQFFLLILISLMVSGCSEPNRRSQILVLQKQVSSCLTHAQDSNKCKVARTKYKLLMAGAVNLQKSPQQFGLSVLHLQTKLIDLKSKNSSLVEIQDLEQKIELYTSLIAFFESPN